MGKLGATALYLLLDIYFCTSSSFSDGTWTWKANGALIQVWLMMLNLMLEMSEVSFEHISPGYFLTCHFAAGTAVTPLCFSCFPSQPGTFAKNCSKQNGLKGHLNSIWLPVRESQKAKRSRSRKILILKFKTKLLMSYSQNIKNWHWGCLCTLLHVFLNGNCEVFHPHINLKKF